MRRALAVALVLVAACGGDDDEGGTTTSATQAEEPESPTTTSEPATTTTCPPPTGDPPVAAIDLDGDGVDELWRRAGSGASTEIVELHRFDGCAEVPVTLGGVTAQFAVGGTVLLLQGVRCEGGTVVHLGASSDDGEGYATLDLVYELRDGELVRVDERTGGLTTADPELSDYSSFEC